MARRGKRAAAGVNVDVQLACGDDAPRPEDVVRWAAAALDGDGRALCIRVVDVEEGAALNGRFRDRDQATNVLAFPADEADLLGDIAICAPVAAREAREQCKPLDDHYAHLVVHGVLHLKGLDHETETQAVAMEAQEARLLKRLGIADPYDLTDLTEGATA